MLGEQSQPVQPEQCFIHEARSQACGVIKELSTLHLAPSSVLGTENREGGGSSCQGGHSDSGDTEVHINGYKVRWYML